MDRPPPLSRFLVVYAPSGSPCIVDPSEEAGTVGVYAYTSDAAVRTACLELRLSGALPARGPLDFFVKSYPQDGLAVSYIQTFVVRPQPGGMWQN